MPYYSKKFFEVFRVFGDDYCLITKGTGCGDLTVDAKTRKSQIEQMC